MRYMSFALTTPQVLARTKTVTRRLRWWMRTNVARGTDSQLLRIGELLQPNPEREIRAYHECPACGEICYCDMEDHDGELLDSGCSHDCDTDQDDDFDDYGPDDNPLDQDDD